MPQKPHKWNGRKDAMCCIACEKKFKRGDDVFTDCAVNLHVACFRLYRDQLVELGLTKPSEAKMNITDFWNQQAEWSQATFGSDKDRGPQGPLLHLAKEVNETLANPTDIIEYADCLFLIFDATRRAGFTFDQLLNAAFAKLAVNKKRRWDKATSDKPVEHIRD